MGKEINHISEMERSAWRDVLENHCSSWGQILSRELEYRRQHDLPGIEPDVSIVTLSLNEALKPRVGARNDRRSDRGNDRSGERLGMIRQRYYASGWLLDASEVAGEKGKRYTRRTVLTETGRLLVLQDGTYGEEGVQSNRPIKIAWPKINQKAPEDTLAAYLRNVEDFLHDQRATFSETTYENGLVTMQGLEWGEIILGSGEDRLMPHMVLGGLLNTAREAMMTAGRQ